MINFNNLLKKKPFELKKNKKKIFFFDNQKKLTLHHYKNSKEFKKVADLGFPHFDKVRNSESLPYLHSKLFKLFNLKSTKFKKIKTLKSSGTSGSDLSKINIDFKTSLIQASVLKKIIFNFIPKDTNTIFIIDSKKNFYDIKNFNAKTAAIRGFAQNFKKKYFLLNKNYQLNLNLIKILKKKTKKETSVYFGFTNIIWENFIQVLKKKKIKLNESQSYFIHGGGWKKLESRKIKKKLFNNEIEKNLGITKVINYYGMIEQTGSIFMECEYGYFHSSIFSDIFIRNINLDLEKRFKQPGIIQVMSLLPVSYPGHNIITEDIGVIMGEDNCKCGRMGKFFRVLSRIKNSDNRGCANV